MKLYSLQTSGLLSNGSVLSLQKDKHDQTLVTMNKCGAEQAL